MTDLDSFEIRQRLSLKIVASCECLTKTPEPNAHDINCMYRVLSDAIDLIDSLDSKIESLDYEIRYMNGNQ